MAFPAVLSDRSAILVVVDLLDNETNNFSSVLRLSNVPSVVQEIAAVPDGIVPNFDGADFALFDDRLLGPVQLLKRLSVEQTGGTSKGVETIGGSVDFSIGTADGVLAAGQPYDLWQWLDLAWHGRNVRIYQGDTDEKDFANFDVVYTGIVDDMTHDLNQASIKLGGMNRAMDSPINTDLYSSGPDNIINKCKPLVLGYVRSIKPILFDEANQIYHISTAFGHPALDVVENVRVGGILWEYVVTITPGYTGQYTVDFTNGTLTLSGAPGNLEVTCDVKAIGWGTLTTAGLIQAWLVPPNISYDAANFAAFDADVPFLVGYYTGLDSVNRLTAIDEAVTSAGGVWSESDEGEVRIYAIKTPEVTSDDVTYDLDDAKADGIIDLKLTQTLPRVHKVRREYSRNWNPMTTFADMVSEDDQKNWSSTGEVVTPFDDSDIADFDPTSLDLPIIRTLFNDLSSANYVGIRLSDAWSPIRKIYEITLSRETGELYSTIELNYRMIFERMVRIISIQKNLGGNTQIIQVWG
jgi:hypothetical protein